VAVLRGGPFKRHLSGIKNLIEEAFTALGLSSYCLLPCEDPRTFSREYSTHLITKPATGTLTSNFPAFITVRK
jgi:hypothetical protein